MKNVSIIVAFGILLFGIYFNQINKPTIEFKSDTLSAEDEKEVEKTNEKSVTPLPTTEVNPTQGEIIQITKAPSPSVGAIKSDNYLTIFIYPNSKVVNESEVMLTLESTDSPNTITEWYKSMIKNRNMSINSFVVTSNNDNISNKLVGVSGTTKIEVDINKNASASTTTISVRNDS
ncbi:hypothetical protein IPM62_04935 [Candidatus Woesebacteria bacterium]|nr:MAG: hypothetical protein IPM62_04935 [Candidatus Woesebacteria bacterium]